MGNKLGKRRQVVDEKYTRPQGLYNHKDVDHKKLRKLILESKLAPCYPGDEESADDREECPICFLYYPSLNRSRCCTKSICTECFLQMKVPNSTRPTQCPFCKTENYAVEYRGVKSKEEKGLEQIEEQRVIEAKIRMRQQELQDEEENMHKRLEMRSSNVNVAVADVAYSSNAVSASSVSVEHDEIVSSQDSCATSVVIPNAISRTNRDGEFDVDLEDIMVMEAIWLSIQENGRQRNISFADATSGQYIDGCYVSSIMGPPTGSSSSPSGGLACAIAALAERQQMAGESSTSFTNEIMSSFNTPQGSRRFHSSLCRDMVNYPSTNNLNEEPSDDAAAIATTRSHGEWDADHGAQLTETATSYTNSVSADDCGELSSLPWSEDIDGSLQSSTEPIVPESFEEQMMLAMAVSLAESRAMPSERSSSWQ